MSIINTSNINTIWASLIIEELIRCGVDYFCISPGSRSTPLAVAVANHKKARSFIHFDERGSAFHALGYAAAAKKAACVITTSGTAVANLFPAVIETAKKKLPLIILTADRPPELRFTGANQTIDQVKIFGDYTNWFFDMPAPSTDCAPEFILTSIDQAVAKANGYPKGPVHLNCMFREPLAPLNDKNNYAKYLTTVKNWGKRQTPFTIYAQSQIIPEEETVQMAAQCLKKAKQGIIVAGKLADRQEQAAVLKLSEKLNWPILPDISSGLRLGCSHPNIITHFDLALSTGTFNTDKPDCVLHLGGRITSKRFYEYIERVRPEHYITVLNHPLRNDPLHIVTLRIQGKVKNVCQQLLKSCSQRTDHKKLALWQKVNNTISEKLNHIFAENTAVTEPAVCRSLSRLLPKNTNLLLGNSLSIREMDSYADPGGASITVSANRGASGIDGTMATACGFIEGKSQPATLLLGDLSFLYDLNSLDMINRLQKPLIIIVFNNDGGGIFSFLPIANEKKLFETYFGTPHGRTFENIAKTFKIMYASPENMQDFENIYQKFSKNKQSVIIELKTQRAENRKWQTQVQNALKTKS